MRKLTVDDGKEMVIALQNEISRSTESRCDNRLHGALMVAKELSRYDISKILDHSPRTVEYWVK